MNPIKKLTSLGQSLWYDNIQRKLLDNGELKIMIQRGDIRGVTSNPTIFNNAISKTTDYDTALASLAWAGWDSERIFWELAIEDIRDACDLFMSLYLDSKGGDGYVSLEVNPFLADDTIGTIAQAEQLWARVARPNLMVKIPATKAGIPAIRKAVLAGVNVNVTLIFSLDRYAEVMLAYQQGLEDRLGADLPVDHIASVASFFVSRLDTKVDAKLPEGSPLLGKTAVANARLAYEAFTNVFTTHRWEKLKLQGAHVQRPLWASTGTKNPSYPDTLYVDNLIGPETVNTVPPVTLNAFRDHGVSEVTISRDLEDARSIIQKLENFGISINDVTRELEDEGVKSFQKSFQELLAAIEEKRKYSIAGLEPLAESMPDRIGKLDADLVPGRLWDHDASLWTTDTASQDEIKRRMGWLDSPEKARALIPLYASFAREIHQERIDRVLVIGMGGSSLTAEVLSSLLAAGKIEAPLSLAILDSTDPQQVRKAAEDFPPSKSLYIIASKSGGTTEVMAGFNYFWDQSKNDGSRFIAITDPGTNLEKLARECHFRRIFLSDEKVGGRFSALTDFGMVPAALLGVDLQRLVDGVEWFRRQCGNRLPAARNPGMTLGAALADAALGGRDKMTILADQPLSALSGWIEQIVAESSGKDGKGLLPISLEPLGLPDSYGRDRFFVYLRQKGELDRGVALLRDAGFPVIQFDIVDPFEAAAEFFRWEFATVVACHLLGINPFDQPNVQESKERTKAQVEGYHKTGKLTEKGLVEGNDKNPALVKFLIDAKPDQFIAINAYLPRNASTIDALQKLRIAIRAKTGCAVTAGFGPRFHHSTGQYHKGGPNKGLFVQVLYDPDQVLEIPGEGMTFGVLLRAQALGDYEALMAANRHVLRLEFDGDVVKELNDLADVLDGNNIWFTGV